MSYSDNPHHKNEVLMQLFVFGPTWDGNLVSKSDRNELATAGLADYWEGWNFLTREGVKAAVAGGYAAKDLVRQAMVSQGGDAIMNAYQFYSRDRKEPRIIALRDDLSARKVAALTTDVLKVERNETVIWRRVEIPEQVSPAT